MPAGGVPDGRFALAHPRRLAGSSQVRHDLEAMVAARREAMRASSFMDGAWRGPAWVLEGGGRQQFVQTERVGALLGGAVRLVEGRGYGPDGRTQSE